MLEILAKRIEARSVLNVKGNYFKMDNRYCHGICIPFENSLNRFYNEKSSCLLEVGNALIIPKGTSYELDTINSGTVGLINFVGEVNIEELNLIEVLNPTKAQKLFADIENSESEYLKLSCFYRLVDYLAGNLLNMETDNVISVQLEYMKKHYGDTNIDNEFLAKMTNISEIYFRRIFKEITGVSPHKYLQNFRINTAKKLLKQNMLSIEEISVTCGFGSVYYFSNAFKKSEGMSPRQYAKMFRFI